MFDDERLADNSLGYSYKYELNIKIIIVVIVQPSRYIAVNCALVYFYGTWEFFKISVTAKLVLFIVTGNYHADVKNAECYVLCNSKV